MKVFIILSLVAIAAAAVAPKFEAQEDGAWEVQVANARPAQRNQILINILITQLINYLRRLINNGSPIFGIPPMDPFELEHFHLVVPAGLVNLDIEIVKGIATGFGGFVVNRSVFVPSALTFDVDITFPLIEIKAESYRLEGDLFSAIPLYGNGEANFAIRSLRVRGLLHLKQSEDGKSIIIERIENPWFELPAIESHLTGVIGGGDLDAIVNALIQEVFVDYLNRFSGGIAQIGGATITAALNPVLGNLDTWRYIDRFV